MNNNNINILITGGLGFIGWHLAKFLLSTEKFNVNIVDRKTAWFGGYDFDNLYTKDETTTQSNSFSRTDLENFYIDDGMYIKKANVVLHLGEYSRVEKSIESKSEFEKVIESNMFGTGNVLLKYMESMSDAIFLYAGSSTSFSDEKSYLQTPYSFTKYFNAELIKCMSKWFDLQTGIIYFYNVFGDYERDDDMGTVVAKFKKNFYEGKKIDVYGGQQTRRFTYIGDVIRNITNLILVSLESGLHGDEFHMVSKDVEETSIKDLARLFYDDDMINYYPQKDGCRTKSIDQETLLEKNCYGEYKVSIQDYIKFLKSF